MKKPIIKFSDFKAKSRKFDLAKYHVSMDGVNEKVSLTELKTKK